MFDIDVQQVQVYTCADGTQFYDLQQAKDYNQKLIAEAERKKFEEQIELASESYCNKRGFASRQGKAQKKNVVSDFLAWYLNWDGVAVEAKPEEIEVAVAEEVTEDSIPF